MPQITHLNQLPGLNSLRRATNKGGLYRFLEFNAFRDVMCWVDDFNGDVIDLNYWSVEQQGGTGDEDFATNIAQGAVTGTGVIQGDTGTTDNNAVSLIGPIIYKGDNHAGMWARFSVDVVTDWNFEIGFIDAKPGSNASGVTDIDTPTAVAANIAVVQLDTDQDLDAAFLTKGSTANQSVKATTMAGFAPTNATYCEVMVQLIGDDAYAHASGAGSAQVAHNVRVGTNLAGFHEGGTPLAPWVFNRTRSTTAKFMNIDAIAIWSYRSAQ
jgi:hypothetical protein